MKIFIFASVLGLAYCASYQQSSIYNGANCASGNLVSVDVSVTGTCTTLACMAYQGNSLQLSCATYFPDTLPGFWSTTTYSTSSCTNGTQTTLASYKTGQCWTVAGTSIEVNCETNGAYTMTTCPNAPSCSASSCIKSQGVATGSCIGSGSYGLVISCQ